MNTEEWEAVLIDYIDGALSSGERERVEKELAGNRDVAQLHAELKEVLHAIDRSAEFEPGDHLQASFEAALKKEMENSRKGKEVSFTPLFYRAAAAVVLIASGVALGLWINGHRQQEKEVQALREELDATKHMMMGLLDNTQSASQRMMGTTVAFRMTRTDDQIVGALTRVLNEDPNTNVRLAALEALGKFHQQESVRRALIASLATQKDPMVQIALIRLMVEMKEKEAIRELERFTRDEQIMPAVKTEAHSGLLKLS